MLITLIIKFPEASHMKLDLGYCLDATSRILLCSSLHYFSRIRIAIFAIAVVACHLSFRMLNSPSLTLIKTNFLLSILSPILCESATTPYLQLELFL